jgi:hypothetical protein
VAEGRVPKVEQEISGENGKGSKKVTVGCRRIQKEGRIPIKHPCNRAEVEEGAEAGQKSYQILGGAIGNTPLSGQIVTTEVLCPGISQIR